MFHVHLWLNQQDPVEFENDEPERGCNCDFCAILIFVSLEIIVNIDVY